MSDLATSLGLCEVVRTLRRRDRSAVEVFEQCAQQVQTHEARLHAFVEYMHAEAHASAVEADRRFATDKTPPLLLGVPVGVKDVIHQRGVPTRAQSKVLSRYTPDVDAHSVAALRQAGAVLMGKLTTHEFAFGMPDEEGVLPPARNPWDEARFAGGSSSGAAVATATGMVCAALATDTAGSVRSPAALCGVVGFKPEQVWVSRAGVIPLSPSLDCVGWLTPKVEDAMLMARVQAANALPDACFAPDGLPALSGDLRGLRVGVIRHFHTTDAPITSDGLQAIDDAVDFLKHAGCQVRDVVLPELQAWQAVGMSILLAEAFSLHEAHLRERAHLYGASVRDALMLGAAISASDYLHAVAVRGHLQRRIDEEFKQVDVLLSVIQAGEAPLFSQLSKWGFVERPSYGLPFNVADLPAMSVPVGVGRAGLPLAVQLVASRGAAHNLFDIGQRLQDEFTVAL